MQPASVLQAKTELKASTNFGHKALPLPSVFDLICLPISSKLHIPAQALVYGVQINDLYKPLNTYFVNRFIYN